MKKVKQTAAALTAFAMAAASMAGCSSTDYAMTANGEKINAGVYINYIMNEMTTQMYTMYYSGTISDVSEIFDQQIDGQDFAAYVKDAALTDTKELAAISAKFDELGLTLSDDDQAEVDDSVASSWESNSEYYEYEGISRDSLQQCYETSYKRQAIFDYYYAEGGIEEVSTDDIQDYVNENYIRYKCITFTKSTNEDTDAAAEEDEELQALVDSYLAEAKELDFAGFDQVIDEYAAYQEEQSAEEEDSSDSEDDETAVTELDSSADSAADDSEQETEDTTDTDTTDTEADSAAEDSEDSADSEESEETDTDDSAAESDDSEADGEDSEDEETDPYENETVLNYTDYVDTDSDSYDEDTATKLEKFKSAEYGVADTYSTEDYIYLYITADISERTDYVDDNKDTLLQEIKGDDFDALVDSWVEDLKITLNEKAIKRYTVKDLYDRQNDYYSSNAD